LNLKGLLMSQYSVKLFMLLFGVYCAGAFAAAGPERLQLATQEWPPYQTYSSDTIAGLSVNRLKCVLRQLEQPYKLTMTSWENAQLGLQSEQQDALFVAEKSVLMDKFAVFSSPLIYHQWHWYFSNSLNDINVSSTNKLKWKVAAKFGTNKWFHLHQEGFEVVKKPRNVITLLDMLMHNEVDAILVDELSMQIALKKRGMAKNSFRTKKMTTKPLGVYFHKNFVKKYPEFLAKFNQAIPSCIE